jgi:hypothetical protein
MLMLLAPELKAMPLLATSETLELDPFKLKFVAVGGAGTEIVTLPAPTPTDAIPAPEKFNSPENVPAELLVVFPMAVRDCENV